MSHLGAAYTTQRASGLSGVPKNTLYYWARTGLLVPSVSTERTMRWSFADLLAIRLLAWLRRDKPDLRIAATPLRRIRDALAAVEKFGAHIADEHVRVRVDAGGELLISVGQDTFVPLGLASAQLVVPMREIDLIAPFEASRGYEAPDLSRPRPTLRIIPGKLAGEPHVADTRIPTTSLAALRHRGLSVDEIVNLYPGIETINVEEAVSLEDQLGRAA